MKKIILVLALILGACSGCRYFPSKADPMVGMMGEARHNTVKITALGDMGGWFATGWYIANDGTDAVVATAGHVCEPDAIYSLMDSDNVAHFALNLWDDDERDLCLLYVPFSGKHSVMKITSRAMDDIAFGEKIWYTGFPNGFPAAIEGRLTAQDGSYLGGSLQVYFGASGSAVLDSSGYVVGVVSAVQPKFTVNSYYAGNVRLLKAMADGYLAYGTEDFGAEE